MTDERVRAAEFEVDRARGKLVATLNEVSRQFEPHRLMEEAWDRAKDKGASLAEDAVDAVSRRPVATGAVIAGLVAFFAREPLMNLAGKLANGTKGKSRKRRKSARGKADEAPHKQQTEEAG
jgi:hypothetical protein